MNEHEVIYEAAASSFGLVVRGSIAALRKARGEHSDDPGLVDLAILGPDERGQIWIVRKDKLREWLHKEDGE